MDRFHGEKWRLRLSIWLLSLDRLARTNLAEDG
jgi:hypothetical protein